MKNSKLNECSPLKLTKDSNHETHKIYAKKLSYSGQRYEHKKVDANSQGHILNTLILGDDIYTQYIKPNLKNNDNSNFLIISKNKNCVEDIPDNYDIQIINLENDKNYCSTLLEKYLSKIVFEENNAIVFLFDKKNVSEEISYILSQFYQILHKVDMPYRKPHVKIILDNFTDYYISDIEKLSAFSICRIYNYSIDFCVNDISKMKQLYKDDKTYPNLFIFLCLENRNARNINYIYEKSKSWNILSDKTSVQDFLTMTRNKRVILIIGLGMYICE